MKISTSLGTSGGVVVVFLTLTTCCCPCCCCLDWYSAEVVERKGRGSLCKEAQAGVAEKNLDGMCRGRIVTLPFGVDRCCEYVPPHPNADA